MDSGPEFVLALLAERADVNHVVLEFIKPVEPTQNSHAERFKRTYRTEVTDMYAFLLFEVRRSLTDGGENTTKIAPLTHSAT